MMLKRVSVLGALAAFVTIGGLVGCSDDNCPSCPPPNEVPALSYVGSATCGDAACHQSTYETFMESGHPYKLTAVENNTAPTYPWDSEHVYTVAQDGPPPGTTWDMFAYVIGGYGWKARFVKLDGNVYTTGTQAQLNLWGTEADKWVPYDQDAAKPYNYGCFKCHTTGASDQGSWPAGTTGFGTFAFGGVQCEECHGMGSRHAFDPENFPMAVDASKDLCGRCHHRDAQNRVAVSGGFIRHHEQYDETIHSPHAAVGCNGCHDPHASVKYDDVALGNGVKTQCISCHTGYDANLTHNSVPECTDCHMPDAAKSARADYAYKGDIASHLFQINTDPVGKDAMWTSDGKFVQLDEFGKGRVTLDFACYGCHKDENGVGGIYSTKTLAELSAKAKTMHSGVVAVSLK